MTDYRPKNHRVSPRFCDPAGYMRLPLEPEPPAEVDFAVVGIPFDDAVTFRPGARFAPRGVREMSRVLRNYNPALDVDVFEHLKGVDAGDIPVVPGFLEDTYERIEAGIFDLLQRGVVPIGIGGDHSVTLGELRAAARICGPLALVVFDAHCDTADEFFGHKYNNGTPFRRALEEGLIEPRHSIVVGLHGPLGSAGELPEAREMGFTLITRDEAESMGTEEVGRCIHAVAGGKPVFMSFDIDCVDPAYAPGTGIPEAGGFTGVEALRLVRTLCGLDIRAADLVEVCPPSDPGEVTCLLAANIIWELLSVLARNKKE